MTNTSKSFTLFHVNVNIFKKATFQPLLLFKMRVVLQKHEGGRVQGLVEVEVGRNVAADVTMVLMREKPPQLFISLHRLDMAARRQT